MSQRLLLASVHDVAPRFEGEVDRLLDHLAPHVGTKAALLAVPDHWGESPLGCGIAVCGATARLGGCGA